MTTKVSRAITSVSGSGSCLAVKNNPSSLTNLPLPVLYLAENNADMSNGLSRQHRLVAGLIFFLQKMQIKDRGYMKHSIRVNQVVSNCLIMKKNTGQISRCSFFKD